MAELRQKWYDSVPLRIIPYQKHSAAFNMAVDDMLFLKGSPVLRTYGWDPPSLSFGRLSKQIDDIDLEYCRELGIGLVIRKTGGKTVFHDQELTYSIILPAKVFPKGVLETYREVSNVISEALLTCGVITEASPAKNTDASSVCFKEKSSYEITSSQRKLVGSAQHRNSRTILQHGSIMMNVRWDIMIRLWKKQHSLDELQSRITCLSELLPEPPSPEKLSVILEKAAATRFSGVVHQDLNQNEIEEIHSLMTKYLWPPDQSVTS